MSQYLSDTGKALQPKPQHDSQGKLRSGHQWQPSYTSHDSHFKMLSHFFDKVIMPCHYICFMLETGKTLKPNQHQDCHGGG